jgi:hypothetical protein
MFIQSEIVFKACEDSIAAERLALPDAKQSDPLVDVLVLLLSLNSQAASMMVSS